MLNWFFDLLAAKTAKRTKARIVRLERMVLLSQAVYELQHTRKNPTTKAQRAVLHAAGKVRAKAATTPLKAVA